MDVVEFLLLEIVLEIDEVFEDGLQGSPGLEELLLEFVVDVPESQDLFLLGLESLCSFDKL